MSRLKRQRLTSDGIDRVTAATDDTIDPDEERSQTVAKEQQTSQQKGRSLFVRSLPQNATSEGLTHFFSQSFPLKHATVVIDSESKQSKGYGFVTFADIEDAQSAKDIFDGSLFEGRKIKVELAEPRHRQAKEDELTGITKAKIRPGPQKREYQHPSKLIVRNLPWTIKEPEHLAILFRSYGKVKHATLPKKKPGLSAGFGFVVLRGRKNAERALEGVNGKEVDGRTLAVDWAVEKEVWETLQGGDTGTEIRDRDVDAPTGKHDKSVNPEDSYQIGAVNVPQSDIEQSSSSDWQDNQPTSNEGDEDVEEGLVARARDNSTSTLFIRNLPFTSTNEVLRDHFQPFGPVRYARVVLDRATERPKGTGFVCFYNQEDANSCLREAPRMQLTSTTTKGAISSSIKQSLLEDTSLDRSGQYTIEGRVLQLSRAVDRNEATRLTFASSNARDARDKDRRRLYLLSEGTVPSNTPLYDQLSPSEVKMREDSAKQRQSLIRSNPTLHLSLTRLSIRNLPRTITSKNLKALAREAVVDFAKDVKSGFRKQLSKEELSRGGEEIKQAERARKAKGKGIVKQAKIVFEGREGSKVTEDSGAGRSRGYGFIEYSSHRWALMGLRWLNGHAVEPAQHADHTESKERRKRLIAEFAIENAQVVGRRQERETKARERSRVVSEKREKGELPNAVSKRLTKDQLMAKTRKGMKRERVLNPKSLVQDYMPEGPNAREASEASEKLAKRQQIIGRKRMMRRSRGQIVSK
ncbi:RNA recognition motif-containing protein [Imshaugia aleurites]|uniref:RNA recognition motif-containing protein n=1 Tax=Imshaugia aleurites TaxID=172621 RepID=A0A8H3G1E6_9LECA|nr:RNA recognition motif-containing protein [Imshaugia aleurites]